MTSGSRDGRRRSKFARFVVSFGTEKLAEEIEVDSSAIRHWLGGRTSPDPARIQRIQDLAARRDFDLSFRDIYSLRRESHSKRGISAKSPLRRA